ncbi:phosphoglucosamine mutase [Mechercharimyces sp. CAU 1602]|uniref:phosphoglucosamine mutase n=1 Tax=Mechercharimyces sp. CAU 1602 TaxID=2973933 RepID=UPI0021615916|nr:phosphoglucosamine mutase [Mechercharimyces sp. CAU 1602]MCS1352085.1 phosphoglucosamine mutase [Mechercharimyces sp. CAU 1602]
MGQYFGTDGVRGVANTELTPELAFQLGRCGAYYLTKVNGKKHVIVGRDTRLSGEMLEAAFVAGVTSVGVDVTRLGVVTTPGVAFLTTEMGAGAGVMISASHNPYPDNGIKFFGADGYKLSDESEAELERLIVEAEDNLPRPSGNEIGRIYDRPEAFHRYLEHVQASIDTDLCGMTIVVDCANGGAANLAPRLLRDLGADVITLHAKPDGMNINVDCGSTHPQNLQHEVVSRQAHVGLAFDGDADRLVAVDEQGELVDGDGIMAICAKYLKERGELTQNKVVATVMSNIGFMKGLEQLGIEVETTAVGDRYVMEAMRKEGLSLGGEQSGHIIFLEHGTTGDGLLSAVQLLRVLKDRGQSLGDLAKVFTKFPQVLVNVTVKDKESYKQSEKVQTRIAAAEAALGDDGRVLVRPSGTEPLVRVMAEGPDEEQINHLVAEIATAIEEA